VIYLPDTNVWSRYLRDRKEDAALCDKVESCFADCRLSAIALMELEYGAAKRADIPIFRDRVMRLQFLCEGRVVVFDEAAAAHAGFLRAHLARLKPNAQPIGPYDALLAGQALAIGAVLVTHNRAEFLRVPGLVCEDWQHAVS